MGFSAAAMHSLEAQVTPEAWLFLLTLRHDDLAISPRFVDNNEDVTSDLGGTLSPAATFQRFPFRVVLPAQSGSAQIPRLQLTFDRIATFDQDGEVADVVFLIRTLSTAPIIDLHLIVADDPNTVQLALPNLEWRVTSYDARTVQGDLVGNTKLDQRFPYRRFSPNVTPGLFPSSP